MRRGEPVHVQVVAGSETRRRVSPLSGWEGIRISEIRDDTGH